MSVLKQLHTKINGKTTDVYPMTSTDAVLNPDGTTLKETLENLSTPFYTTKKDGTGLGVCLSKEIIEAHKGKINYTSVLYMGTTAKIVLPIN